MLVSFPDYTEEGGLPSIKLAVYSNIQLKECQLWTIISKQNSTALKSHWLVSYSAVVTECSMLQFILHWVAWPVSSLGHSPAVSSPIGLFARQDTVSLVLGKPPSSCSIGTTLALLVINQIIYVYRPMNVYRLHIWAHKFAYNCDKQLLLTNFYLPLKYYSSDYKYVWTLSS